MKSLRTIVIGLALVGMVVFLSSLAFAKEGCMAGKMNHDAKVRLLTDSAAALQKSNPDLAKGLQEMCVDKPKDEMQKMMQEKKEKEEVGEKVEPKGDK